MMWIIPKNLPIYHYAQDMKVLGVDSEEFSQMSEKSLMWRSKPSLSQTWLRRWKRVTYMRHLSTRILRPSHTKNFMEKWISSQQAFLANRSAPLVAELPQKILDTFTHTSQKEFQSADQLMLFSKTSRGLSQVKQPMASRYSSMSSEIWKKEVIEHRGEYSQRVKLALHTNGRECLSWPTATSSDGEGGRIETILNKGGFKSKRKTSGQVRGAKLRDAVETYENWPTADATNVSDGIPWEISGKQLEERRARVKIAVAEGKTKAGSGRSVNLAMAVQRELAWATPTTQDTIEHKDMKLNEKGRRLTKDGKDSHSVGLGDQVKIEKGEKSWTERKELSADYKETTWATPISRDWKDTGDIKNWESTENYQMSLPKQAGLQDQEKSSTNGKSQESWKTPTHQDSRIGPNNIGGARQRKERGSEALADQTIKPSPKATSVLNPNWVEQLMGLPVGWTQLPTEWTD